MSPQYGSFFSASLHASQFSDVGCFVDVRFCEFCLVRAWVFYILISILEFYSLDYGRSYGNFLTPSVLASSLCCGELEQPSLWGWRCALAEVTPFWFSTQHPLITFSILWLMGTQTALGPVPAPVCALGVSSGCSQFPACVHRPEPSPTQQGGAGAPCRPPPLSPGQNLSFCISTLWTPAALSPPSSNSVFLNKGNTLDFSLACLPASAEGTTLQVVTRNPQGSLACILSVRDPWLVLPDAHCLKTVMSYILSGFSVVSCGTVNPSPVTPSWQKFRSFLKVI